MSTIESRIEHPSIKGEFRFFIIIQSEVSEFIVIIHYRHGSFDSHVFIARTKLEKVGKSIRMKG
ncbi:hypothetical protein PMSD_07090 [Paenibacillus macquariensis subsp. defensor]|nr:hypothetical protein PMSD_07090 [Paenibacillus macquariensis subsp. defensor]